MSSYRRVGAVTVGVALVPLVVGRSAFLMRLAVLALVFSLFGIALNVAFGHTDQLFLFLGGLSGIGAYTTALSADGLGVSPLVTLPAGILLCAIVAGLVSYVSAKREFTVILIAILTLNLQLALVEFYNGAREVTRGSTGFAYEGIVPDALGEAIVGTIGFEPEVGLYYVLVVVVALALVGYVRLVNSRYGVGFEAIREDETAAASVGVDVVRYKTLAGALTGGLVAVAGVMHVEFTEFVEPGLFSFLQIDVLVLIMLVLGGLRTAAGPVVGAFLVIAVEELLLLLTDFQTALFGALLIVLFLYFRSGVVPTVEGLLEQVEFPGRGGGSTDVDEEPGD